MATADAKKVLDLCDALEVNALADIAARRNKGERLTVADLKVIDEVRKRHSSEPAPKDESPADSLVASILQRRGMPPELLHFQPATDVARMIGCTDRMLRDYCVGSEGLPPLPHQTVGKSNKYLIQPAVAYEFILRFARRRPKNLRAPTGWISEADSLKLSVGVASPAAAPDFSGNPIDLLKAAVSSPELLDKLGYERVRVLGQLVEQIRRHDEALSKAARRFNEDEVGEMLRAVGREWCRQFLVWMPAATDVLVAYIRDKFGVDLREQNIAARDLLQATLTNDGERMLLGFQKHMEDQVKGVQYLKGSQ